MNQTTPILYYDDVSPPVRFVLMTIRSLNLKIELKHIDLFARQQTSTDYMKINPLHTVPTLSIGDVHITDSHAICIYLATEYAPESKIYPQNPLQRAKVDKILFFNSGIFFPRESLILQSPFNPIRQPYSIMVEKFLESLEYLDKFCQESKWLAGDQVTLADLCCIATYSTAELLVIINKGKYKNVDKWVAACKKLQVYQTDNVPGLHNLKTAILKYGNIDHIDVNQDEIMNLLQS